MCFFRTLFLKQTSTFFVEVCMFYLYMGFVRFSNIFPQSKDVYVSLTGHSKWLSVLMLAQYETCLSSYQSCDRFHIRSQENGWIRAASSPSVQILYNHGTFFIFKKGKLCLNKQSANNSDECS